MGTVHGLLEDVRRPVHLSSPHAFGDRTGLPNADPTGSTGWEGERVHEGVVRPDVVEAFRRYRFEACLLGVGSLDPSAGLTVPDRDEAVVKSATVERSSRMIAVASPDKLRTAKAFLVAPAEAVTVLITDAAPDDPAVTGLHRVGTGVVCVPDAQDFLTERR